MTTPGDPTDPVATPAPESATISWVPPVLDGGSPITSYMVTASPGGSSCTYEVTTPESDACTVTGLQDGISYVFSVSATSAVGTSSGADISLPVTPAAAPADPTDVVATAGDAQATVGWTPPGVDGGDPITSYTVTASPGGSSCTYEVTTPESDTCTVAGLQDGTTYTFSVSATSAVGSSPGDDWSDPATPATLPSDPTGPVAVAGPESATISWLPPSDDGGVPITSYTVTASPGGLSCVDIVDVPETDTCTITGLQDGTAYTFDVTATNAVGTSPGADWTDPVTPATIPGAPVHLSATAGSGQATVAWSPPSDDGGAPISSYTVIADPGWSSCTYEVTTPETDTCTITGLQNGTSYTFTAVATNAVGTGPSSAPSSAVVPATAPGAPTSVVATAGAGQATIRWTAPSSNGGAAITSYTVTAMPGGKTCTDVLGNPPVDTCTITGLANGTSYSFRVSATNAEGTGPSSGSSQPVTPATAPSAPTSVTATAGVQQITVTWSPPTSNGGAPITRYTATASPGGKSCTVVVSASSSDSCTITGLAAGVSETVSVTATNSAGTSVASSPSSPVIPVL